MAPDTIVVLVLLLCAASAQSGTASPTWVRQLLNTITGISTHTMSNGESPLGAGPDAETVDVFWGVPDTSATIGNLFRYQIPHNAFTGKVDRFKVNEAGLSELPPWLYFNSSSKTFLGVASALDMGATAIEVMATVRNGNHSASTNFIIKVQASISGIPGDPRLAMGMKYRPDRAPVNMDHRHSGVCQLDQDTYEAVLILDTAMDKLSAKMRIKLIYKAAHFLSQRVPSLHIRPRRSASIRRLMETSTVSAGPGDTGQNKTDIGVELSWNVGCDTFKGAADLAKILQHNVQVGRFREELGYQLIGWLITKTLLPEFLRKLSRQKRQAGATPMATPTLPPSVPSRVTDVLTVSLLETTSLVPLLSQTSLPPSAGSAASTTLIYKWLFPSVNIFSTSVASVEDKQLLTFVKMSSTEMATGSTANAIGDFSQAAEVLSSVLPVFLTSFDTSMVSTRPVPTPSSFLPDRSTTLELSATTMSSPSSTDGPPSPFSLETSIKTPNILETPLPSHTLSMLALQSQPSRTTMAIDESTIPSSVILPTPTLPSRTTVPIDGSTIPSSVILSTPTLPSRTTVPIDGSNIPSSGILLTPTLHSRTTVALDESNTPTSGILPTPTLPSRTNLAIDVSNFPSSGILPTSTLPSRTTLAIDGSNIPSSGILETPMLPSRTTLAVDESNIPSFDILPTPMLSMHSKTSRTILPTDVPILRIAPPPSSSVTPVKTSGNSEQDTFGFVLSTIDEVLSPTSLLKSSIDSSIFTAIESLPNSVKESVHLAIATSRESESDWMIKVASVLLSSSSSTEKFPSSSTLVYLSRTSSSITDETAVMIKTLTPRNVDRVLNSISIFESKATSMALSAHFPVSQFVDSTSSLPYATSSVTNIISPVLPSLSPWAESSSTAVSTVTSKVSTNLISSSGILPGSETLSLIQRVVAIPQEPSQMPSSAISPTPLSTLASSRSATLYPTPARSVANLVSQTPSRGQTLDFVTIGSYVSTAPPATIVQNRSTIRTLLSESPTALQTLDTVMPTVTDKSSKSLSVLASSTFEVILTPQTLSVLHSSTPVVSLVPTPVISLVPAPVVSLAPAITSMASLADQVSSPEPLLTSEPPLLTSIPLIPSLSRKVLATLHSGITSLTSESPAATTWFSTTVDTAATTSSPLTVVTTPVLNHRPQLRNPIDQLNTRLGVYFEYRIPADTFLDQEDGNTLSLKLSLLSLTRKELAADSWVQFDADTQTILGIPLRKDLPLVDAEMEFVLVAEDRLGLEAYDAFRILIDVTSYANLTHQFVVTVIEDYQSFVNVTNNLIQLMATIARFYGDKLPTAMTVTNVTSGSVAVHWSNNTLSRVRCEKETAQRLFTKLSAGGRVHPDFRRAVFPRYNILDVGLRYEGACAPQLPIPPQKPPIAPPNTYGETTDSSIYYKTVLPAVAVALLLLVSLIVCICLQRRRRLAGRLLLDDEKPIFAHDRHPVLLESELEMRHLHAGKPSRPLVLTQDGGIVNDAFPAPAARCPPARPPPYRVPAEYSLFYDDSDEFDGASISPPPDYASETGAAGVYARPPPSYRLPPPYTPQPSSSDA